MKEQQPYMLIAYTGSVQGAREYFAMVKEIAKPTIEPVSHPVFEAKIHAEAVRTKK